MRLLICGSRDWNNKKLIKDAIIQLQQEQPIEVIIHGGCRGADWQAGEAAKELDIPVQVYYADWDTYGKSAGPRRNQTMLEEGQPTYALAFHPDINSSKGTGDMIRRIVNAGIDYRVITGKE